MSRSAFVTRNSRRFRQAAALRASNASLLPFRAARRGGGAASRSAASADAAASETSPATDVAALAAATDTTPSERAVGGGAPSTFAEAAPREPLEPPAQPSVATDGACFPAFDLSGATVALAARAAANSVASASASVCNSTRDIASSAPLSASAAVVMATHDKHCFKQHCFRHIPGGIPGVASATNASAIAFATPSSRAHETTSDTACSSAGGPFRTSDMARETASRSPILGSMSWSAARPRGGRQDTKPCARGSRGVRCSAGGSHHRLNVFR